jgi:hypothetical protein
MKTLARSLLISLLLARAAQAQVSDKAMAHQFPQQQSAGDLLRFCASSSITPTGRDRRRYCEGFVSGVEEAVRLLEQSDRPEYRLCIPENVSASALAKTYVRYGARHKGALAGPAAETVVYALQQAYSCPAPQ